MFEKGQSLSILRGLQEDWNADAQEAAREIIIEMRDEIAWSFHGNDRTRLSGRCRKLVSTSVS
jgi:hypothetical protein